MSRVARFPLIAAKKASSPDLPNTTSAPRTRSGQADHASASRQSAELPAAGRAALTVQAKTPARSDNHAVVQRTEIDAINYINKNGLLPGPREGNWLIKYLAHLRLSGNPLYDTIYEILKKGLPKQPLQATDGYDPPTIHEVESALEHETQMQYEDSVKKSFRESLTDMFYTNHVNENEPSALKRCQDRLKSADGKTPANTVLILSTREMAAILETLDEAHRSNWGHIYISCQKAIQAGGMGVSRLHDVTVEVALDGNSKIAHLNGSSLQFAKKEPIGGTAVKLL